MLLALDIGNTNIVVGVFDGERLLHSWRLSTLRQRTADEMGIWLLQLFQHGQLTTGQVDGVVMASVVPTLTRPTAEMASRYFDHEPLVVDGATANRHAGALRRAVRGRRRPHRQRRCRVRALRPAGRPRPPGAHRRGLRHGHDLRRHLGAGRVPSAASSARASTSPPTRCSSGPRACRAWTCASRRRSSGERRSGRCSPACSTATSAWSRASSAACATNSEARSAAVATGGLAEMIAPETAVDRGRRPRPHAARPADDLGEEQPAVGAGLRARVIRPAGTPATTEFMDTDTFCREIESYLCRKNDGHLVRVVGPAFGMVSGWAAQGVPFKVACRGIDRCFERYYAKGPRRRPIRVEFCEADVLDVFDDWKRAVGVGMSGASSAPGHSLRAHLDRAVTRLTDLQAKGGLPTGTGSRHRARDRSARERPRGQPHAAGRGARTVRPRCSPRSTAGCSRSPGR